MENLVTIIWSAVGIIVTGLASWLTAVGVNFLNQKIKDKKFARLSEALYRIIMGAVEATTQTFVDSMKKAGTFDEAAAKEAKMRAYKVASSQLTEELRKFIEENFGDIEEYIMNQIESLVYQLKR